MSIWDEIRNAPPGEYKPNLGSWSLDELEERVKNLPPEVIAIAEQRMAGVVSRANSRAALLSLLEFAIEMLGGPLLSKLPLPPGG